MDRKKVHNALKWLIENNKNYSDIELPQEPEDILPDIFGDDDSDNNSVSEGPIQACRYCNINSFESKTEFDDHESKCRQAYLNLMDATWVSSDNDLNIQSDDNLNASDIDTDDLVSDLENNSFNRTKDNESNYFSSEDESCESSEKPWIKPITAEEFSRDYGHLTVTSVNSDTTQAKELFKQLNIDSNPIPSFEDNIDC